MAYTTIKKPSDYFNTKLYTGNNSTNIISGVGFQPDWFWIKDRSTTGEKHHLFDAVRGLNKALYSNQTTAETTGFDGGGQNNITAVGNDGFTITGNGSDGEGNLTGRNYASWNWLANGTGVANTDGDITSTVSANQTAGFSISTFTVSGSGNIGVGHGLGAKPKVVITKSTSHVTNWNVYHEDTSASPENDYLYLNTTAAKASETDLWGDGMTTTTFGLGVGIGVSVGRSYVAYCFAEKQGFSKFGSYTGNGSTDGTFVYTGFKPAFVMNKMTSGAYHEWNMFDSTRQTFNPNGTRLIANLNIAEQNQQAANYIDLLSNGFKIRTTDANFNGSGSSYIYMAFAEQPLVGDNPATAR